MASEIGPSNVAFKAVVLNPDDPTQVRQVSGPSSPRWTALSGATFSQCMTVSSQVGSTSVHFADLPAGLDAARVYPVLLYVSTATAFTDDYGIAEYVPEVPPGVDTLLSRVGAFAGSGVNTIFGFLRSLARSDVAAPSDVGGSYNPVTDSLQAIRDEGDTDWGDTACTSYVFYGPSHSVVGFASAPFVVSLGSGGLSASVTITPAASGTTFTPATVTLSDATRSASFTATGAASGLRTVSVTNDGGLSNPAGHGLTVDAAVSSDPVSNYELNGPTGGIVDVDSPPFVVSLGAGDLAGSVIFTPHSTNGGDTFSPATVTLTDSDRAASFHLVTPAGTTARTVTATNNGGLSNPAGVIFTPSPDGTPDTGQQPTFTPYETPYYSFTDHVTVTLNAPGGSTSVKYTLDGTDPRTSGTAVTYVSPFTLVASRQVRAVAVFTGPTFGPVVYAQYAKRVPLRG